MVEPISWLSYDLEWHGTTAWILPRKTSSMEVDGRKWKQIELKLADSRVLNRVSECWRMTALELISILHLKATLSNIHMAGKTSDNAGVSRSLRSPIGLFTVHRLVLSLQHSILVK